MEVVQIISTLLYIFLKDCQSKMEPFIVGGDEANVRQFPYIAHLGVKCVDEKNDDIDKWYCGSSIINQDLTLTAGHCVYGCKEKTLIVITVGSKNIHEGAVATGHSFVVHEYFSAIWFANDIAIVRLKTPIKFNMNVSRVALMEIPPYQEEAVLPGWGLVDEKETETNVLKYIKQYVWKKSDCLNLLKWMNDGTFCAGSKKDTDYPAGGDSGSPIVVRGYIQLGIASYKSLKNLNATITVYTDAGYFYDWIMEHADALMCPEECSDCTII